MNEPITTTPAAQPVQLRWMVRLEYFRPSRFGERAAASGAVQWVVTPYLGRHRDGRLRGPLEPRPFPTRTRAFEWARSECARVYQRRRS